MKYFNCLFTVEHGETGQVSNVYGMRETDASTEFLIYYIDKWLWMDYRQFKPYDA